MEKNTILRIISWVLATIILSFIFIPLAKFLSTIIGIGMSVGVAYLVLSWLGDKFNINWLK